MKNWCTKNDIKCYLLCIQRDAVDCEQSNHADSEVYFIQYDSYLNNNGTLNEFKEATLEYLKVVHTEEFDKWINI